MSKKKAATEAANLEPLVEASETPTTPAEEPTLAVEPVSHGAETDPYAAAIQDVLGDPTYVHVGAHGTEIAAIRKLVERGHDEGTATAEVRRRLY